jgi:hypothetical protein
MARAILVVARRPSQASKSHRRDNTASHVELRRVARTRPIMATPYVAVEPYRLNESETDHFIDHLDSAVDPCASRGALYRPAAARVAVPRRLDSRSTSGGYCDAEPCIHGDGYGAS